MGIDKINSNPYSKFNVEQKKATDARNSQNGVEQPQIRNDQVALTDKALHLSKIESAAPVDREKIEAIKKAISDGTFKISPENIADKMIAQEIEFHRKNTQ